MGFKPNAKYVMPAASTMAKAKSNRLNRLKKKDVLEKKKERQKYCKQIKEIYRRKLLARKT